MRIKSIFRIFSQAETYFGDSINNLLVFFFILLLFLDILNS